MKQWGQTPEEIDPNTTARVPVFLSRDDRYFQDAYQGMPLEGYTVLFQRMLDHPGITVELGTDALKRLDLSEGRICLDGAEFSGPVIYTGQADELFAFRFGPLPYRTLDFRFETLAQDDFQGCGTVNYTVDEDYPRITEFKHLTGQVKPGVTGKRPPVRPVPDRGGALPQPAPAGPSGRVQILQHGRHRSPGTGAGRAADLSRAL